MPEDGLPPLGVTQEEWSRLPMRTRLLLNAGMADVDEVMRGWRDHWKNETETQGKEVTKAE